MNKPFLAVLLAALAALSPAAQEAPDTSTLTGINLLDARGLNRYSSLFLNAGGLLSRKYSTVATDADYDRIAVLGGNEISIDTPLEIALLSFSTGVVDIRPAEAAEMLPKGRESSLKAGALIYQNLQAATFLRSSNAAVLATVFNQFCVDNGVNRAEIKTYFDRNIGTAIAAEVDAQFNRVAIPLYRYNAVLTRTTGNQYILSYKDVNDAVKELLPASLEALLATMRKTTGFESTDIDTVRAQAVLIPAVRLNSGALDDIKRIVTAFYTNPTAGTYNAVKEVYALYTDARLTTGEAFFEKTRLGYVAALTILNESLARKVIADAEKQGTYTALTREQQQRLITLR